MYFLILALLFTPPPNNDVIYRTSGVTIEGRITKYANGKFTIITSSGGVRTIASSLIDRVEFSNKKSVEVNGNDPDKPRLMKAEPEESEPLNEGPQILSVGDTYQGDGFEITLAYAEIQNSRVKDMFGKIQRGLDPDLAINMKFRNTDDRKILRYKRENQFLAGHYRLVDDVGNTIRGINYGFGNTPIGSNQDGLDIDPGKYARHRELFKVPLPKTEYLILTVDQSCLYGEGEIKFKIPVSSI
ncbi:hypothetical protein N9X53_03690, partial [Mariniblastus sp.]|nr:hypothetical protein [Mariniblastus sp.]